MSGIEDAVMFSYLENAFQSLSACNQHLDRVYFTFFRTKVKSDERKHALLNTLGS